MRHITALLIALLLPAHSAHASGMAAISSDSGYCSQAPDSSAICYEWSLTTDPSVRFVAYGYEDGIEYIFFRLLPSGQYDHIVHIYPVLQDASRGNALFWGYPWDISDIACHGKGEGVLATLEHELFDDGEVYPPKWQERIPAVLFLGKTTQPAMTVPPLDFSQSTVDSLRSAAGANNSFKGMPLRGTP